MEDVTKKHVNPGVSIEDIYKIFKEVAIYISSNIYNPTKKKK